MTAATAVVSEAPQPLARQLTWWSLAFPVVLIVALATANFALLNWIHVLSGTLWTGADIFMGFMLGPVMRRLAPPQRGAVIAYLVPRTLLYFPAVSFTTSIGGWCLAAKLGYLMPSAPQFAWAVAALVIVTLLTIQGLGVFLPNSIRMWLELRKPEPNRDLIGRLARINFTLAGVQGMLQVAIIVVMSRFVVG